MNFPFDKLRMFPVVLNFTPANVMNDDKTPQICLLTPSLNPLLLQEHPKIWHAFPSPKNVVLTPKTTHFRTNDAVPKVLG